MNPIHAQDEQEEQEVIELSPFEVNASGDMGYVASQTLAGTRLATDLWRVGSQVTIMTPEFLEDIAATSLDEANLYSLNVESSLESVGEDDQANASDAYYNKGSGESPQRVRGLANASSSRDFFFTLVRQDSYNSERFTYASGPNAILFGLGSPGGVVDQSLKRARFQNSATVGLRVDDNNSKRFTLDFNTKVIDDILAVRAVYLYDDAQQWRKPSQDFKKRFFGTVTIKPMKSTTIRVAYENFEDIASPARGILLRDHVSPYLAFREAEMERLGISDPFDPRLYWAPASYLSDGETSIARGASTGTGTQSQARSYMITGQFSPDTAPENYFGWLQGSTQTLPQPVTPGGGTPSIIDETLFPFDVNPTGLVNNVRFDGDIISAFLEQRITKNFHIEAAINREEVRQEAEDWIRGSDFNLKMDVDRYIPNYLDASGNPVLNPNRGQLYLQSNGLYLIRSNQIDSGRITASYDLDFRDQDNFLRWFGRHKIAGLLDFEERDGRQQVGRTTTYEDNGDIRVGSNRNFYLLFHRLYLDPPGSGNILAAQKGIDQFGLIDANYGAAENVTVALFDPEGVKGYRAAGQSTLQRTEGRMIAIQSEFLDERILLTYGKRWDDFMSKRQSTSAISTTEWWNGNHPSIFDLERSSINDNPDVDDSGTNETRGVVAFPFPFLSLFYNESTNQSAEAGAIDPNGGLSPATSGDGKDFGFGLRLFDGRIYLRANFFKTSQLDSRIDTRISVAAGAVENLVDSLGELYPDVGYNPERTWDNSNDFAITNTLADVESEGQEFTLVANPARGWRVSVSAAKTETVQTNKGAAWERYVETRMPEWNKFANYGRESLALPAGDTEETVGEFIQRTIFTQQLDINRLLDGSPNIRVPKWRVNIVSTYEFNSDFLKGFGIGGAYRWRDKGAIGFPQIVGPDGSMIQDINNPYYNDGTTNLDGWLSYKTTLFGGKVRARFQLNVRNLLDDRDLIPIRADAAGNRYAFTPQAPRTFILSSTFTF